MSVLIFDEKDVAKVVPDLETIFVEFKRIGYFLLRFSILNSILEIEFFHLSSY
jgi:hypothetical protein